MPPHDSAIMDDEQPEQDDGKEVKERPRPSEPLRDDKTTTKKKKKKRKSRLRWQENNGEGRREQSRRLSTAPDVRPGALRRESTTTTSRSDGTTTTTTTTTYFYDKLSQIPERKRSIVWRDFCFLILGGVALKIVNWVETNAAYSDRVPLTVRLLQSSVSWMSSLHHHISSSSYRDEGATSILDDYDATQPQSPEFVDEPTCSAGVAGGLNTGIIDTGFVLTTPLYEFLATHRNVNDLLAFLNSLILIIPLIYVVKVTLWKGDYTLAFRLLATQLFRSFCGWFTYLPPDPTFLMSVYDFPEVTQCAFGGAAMCEEIAEKQRLQQEEETLPFVSFFSGHVASTVIIANHMYLRGDRRHAVALHVFNVFQILRLLASRGHYSIDIIIGWVVAVYVSNPAARLGRYYSRGVALRSLVPTDAVEAFETVIGVSDLKRGADNLTRSDKLWLGGMGCDDSDSDDEQNAYLGESATAAQMVAEVASRWAQGSLVELQAELERRGMKASEMKELRRRDLVRMLGWAQLKVDELRAEARRLGLHLPDAGGDGAGASKMDIVVLMWSKTKAIMESRARMASEWAQRSLADLRTELEKHGMRAQEVGEMRRKDVVRLLGWAQLKASELHAEARLLDLNVSEGATKREVLVMMWERTKALMEQRGRMLSSFRSDSSDSFSSDESRSVGEDSFTDEGCLNSSECKEETEDRQRSCGLPSDATPC